MCDFRIMKKKMSNQWSAISKTRILEPSLRQGSPLKSCGDMVSRNDTCCSSHPCLRRAGAGSACFKQGSSVFLSILRTVFGCRRFFEINKLDEAKCFILNLGLHPEFDKKTGHSINHCFIET